MSFQPIRGKKISCKDFKRSFLSGLCTLSHKCKRNGYIPAPNSTLCTGVELSPRPKNPSRGAPVKTSRIALQDGDMI